MVKDEKGRGGEEMITRLTQDLQVGDKYNLSQLGYDPMTIAKVTRIDKTFVRLDGTRDADGSTVMHTVFADMEVFQ